MVLDAMATTDKATVSTVENGHILAIKCVVVGDERVGKSCFIARLLGGSFRTDYVKTMVDMVSLKTMHQDAPMLIDCWDTTGAPNMGTIRKLAYHGTHIFAVCFSVAMPESFESVRTRWIDELKENWPENAKLILIGLQSDLRNDETVCKDLASRGLQCPTTEQCCALAKSIGATRYFECSSKTLSGFHGILDAIKSTVLNPVKLPRRFSTSITESGPSRPTLNSVKRFSDP